MIWPPVKAWTSKFSIDGNFHFVAINYGGQGIERWVVLMSVIDGSMLVKVTWSKLVNPSKWKCGWDENNYSISSELVEYKYKVESVRNAFPSIDSGLTIPITKNIVRDWFDNTKIF